jgi:hypothetical protein
LELLLDVRIEVESIRCSPRLKQPFEVPNAEAPIRELFQKRLIAEVPNDFIHEGKARRRNSRYQVREVGDHLPLRPALAGTLWRKQGANDARGFGRTEVGSAARLRLDRLLTSVPLRTGKVEACPFEFFWERWGASIKMPRQLSSSTTWIKSTASQMCRASSNVSSLVVDECHVYWIEAGMLRRREKG